MEKILPNKFFINNNMDSREVSEELQELIKIKKMLISKVFMVIFVYRLHDR